MQDYRTLGSMLIASAFVLAGLLTLQVARNAESEAQARLVIARDAFTLLTAPGRNSEDPLFVIDNNSGKMLIYELRPDNLALAAGLDLNRVFAQASGGGDDGGRNNRR